MGRLIFALSSLLLYSSLASADIITLEARRADPKRAKEGVSLGMILLQILTNLLAIDLCIISALLIRQSVENLKIHRLLFFCFAFFLTVLRLSELAAQPSHHLWAFTLAHLGLVYIQYRLGSRLRDHILMHSTTNGVFKVRRIHRINGIFLYLWSKKSFFGFVTASFCLEMAFFVSFGYIVFAFMVFLFFLQKKMQKTPKHIRDKYLNDSQYESIVAGVESGRLNIHFAEAPPDLYAPQGHKHDVVSMGGPKGQAAKMVKWVVFENRVCELNGLSHPGGTHIFEAISGYNVTSLIHGDASFFYYHPQSMKILSLKHLHKKIAKTLLKDNCFGLVSRPIFMAMSAETPRRNRSYSNGSFNSLITFDHDSPKGRRTTNCGPSFSPVKTEHLVQFGHSKFAILLLARKKTSRQKKYVVDLTKNWSEIVAKQVIVKGKLAERGVVTPVFFLNPNYLRYRNESLLANDEEVFAYQKRFQPPEISKLLACEDRQDTQLVSNYCPIFYRSNSQIFPIDLEISELLGSNYSFLLTTTKRVFFIIKDAGVVPLLDYFELLVQKLMGDLAEKKLNPATFAKSEFQPAWARPKFTIYWEVSPKFGEAARTLGLYHIQLVKQLQTIIGVRHREILKDVHVDSDCVDFQAYDHLKKARLKNKTLLEILKLAHGQYDRIVVCGSDKFKTWLFGSCRILEEIFTKIDVL